VYTSDLADLVAFLSRTSKAEFSAVTEQVALAWRTNLETRALAPATISRKLTVAKAFFAYLFDLDAPPAGLPSRNPFRRIRSPRFDRTVGKTPCPGPEEVRRLLRAISPTDRRGRRDLLILTLLFNQGLRVSEVARLERSNVMRFGRQTYLSLVGKGGGEVRSVLPHHVARLLDRHLSEAAGPRYVFTRLDGGGGGPDRPLAVRVIHRRLKGYARKAGIDPATVRPHSGRVFFITQSYLLTRDLERVARAVGHRELATTRRYLRLGSVLEDLPARLMHL
jgi:site-specific recombinase XerD